MSSACRPKLGACLPSGNRHHGRRRVIDRRGGVIRRRRGIDHRRWRGNDRRRDHEATTPSRPPSPTGMPPPTGPPSPSRAPPRLGRSRGRQQAKNNRGQYHGQRSPPQMLPSFCVHVPAPFRHALKQPLLNQSPMAGVFAPGDGGKRLGPKRPISCAQAQRPLPAISPIRPDGEDHRHDPVLDPIYVDIGCSGQDGQSCRPGAIQEDFVAASSAGLAGGACRRSAAGRAPGKRLPPAEGKVATGRVFQIGCSDHPGLPFHAPGGGRRLACV
jgi:hypothetical protein